MKDLVWLNHMHSICVQHGYKAYLSQSCKDMDEISRQTAMKKRGLKKFSGYSRGAYRRIMNVKFAAYFASLGVYGTWQRYSNARIASNQEPLCFHSQRPQTPSTSTAAPTVRCRTCSWLHLFRIWEVNPKLAPWPRESRRRCSGGAGIQAVPFRSGVLTNPSLKSRR